MLSFNKVFIPDTVITSTCSNTFLPFRMQQTQLTAAHTHTHYIKSSGDKRTLLNTKFIICLCQQGATGFHINHRAAICHLILAECLPGFVSEESSLCVFVYR